MNIVYQAYSKRKNNIHSVWIFFRSAPCYKKLLNIVNSTHLQNNHIFKIMEYEVEDNQIIQSREMCVINNTN